MTSACCSVTKKCHRENREKTWRKLVSIPENQNKQKTERGLVFRKKKNSSGDVMEGEEGEGWGGGVVQKESLCADRAPPSLCSPPTDEPARRKRAIHID